MDNRNLEFLEAYKHLDKLCQDIFQSGRGISSYIDEMKSTPPLECHLIDNWQSDLKNLLRLRRLRNQLTHECGTLETIVTSEWDIQWVNEFYDHILHQTDPLALLNTYRRYGTFSHAAAQIPQKTEPTEVSRPTRKSFPIWLLIIVFAVAFLVWMLHKI